MADQGRRQKRTKTMTDTLIVVTDYQRPILIATLYDHERTDHAVLNSYISQY
jgi:hypothetical protein